MGKIDKIAAYLKIDKADLSFMSQNKDTISSNLFGDYHNRQYPLHTKEACFAAMAEYLYDSGRTMEGPVYERIDKAAKHYNIEWPKPVEHEDNIVVESTLGDKKASVQFTNSADGFNKAASEILDLRRREPYMLCKNLAYEFMKSAYAHKIPTDSANMCMMSKLAGLGVGDKDIVVDTILKRVNRSGYSEYEQKMQKFADDIYNTPGDILSPDDLTKIAEVLDEWDAVSNAKELYGISETPPEQQIFSKSAADVQNILADRLVIASTNTVISKASLMKHASEILPIMKSFGLNTTEATIEHDVSGLTEPQVNFLFNTIR